MLFFASLVLLFSLYMFVAAIVATLIKLLLFRKHKNTFLKIWGAGALPLAAGLIIEQREQEADGLIPFSLMFLGISGVQSMFIKAGPRRFSQIFSSSFTLLPNQSFRCCVKGSHCRTSPQNESHIYPTVTA